MDTAAEDDVALVARSGLFDREHYAAHVGDAPEGDDEAIAHYLTVGWHSFADPGPGFSTGFYLAENGDVAACGTNPLLHYLRWGKAEGRRSMPMLARRSPRLRRLPAPRAPTEAEWAAIPPREAPGQRAASAGNVPAGDVPAVDVIVPVYKGFAETLRTLHSVLAAPQRTPFSLVVIDDCSPDAALSAALQDLAGRGLIELLRNDVNLGFVATVNRGLALHPDRDVVLLNADTEVHNDWLDRLRAVVMRDRRVATVTPLSNNAEICSYPRFVRDNWLQIELDAAELDRLAATANAGWACDVPTGVGFCMYVRRDCIDSIGPLDVEEFGHGYGEENDFCCRAAAAGWRNVLAGDVFVRHHGGASFGAQKQERIRVALQTLGRLHPGYLPSVEEFVRADPVLPARRALDAARLRARAGHGAVVYVIHNLGGGTEQHARDMADLLEEAGTAVFFARPDSTRPGTLLIEDPLTPETPNLSGFRLDGDVDAFAATLRAIGVRHMHVHNLAGMPHSAPNFVRHAAMLAGLRYDVTLHDYGVICPRVTLIDRSNVYCGEPEPQVCQRCIARDASPNGKPDVIEWRAAHEAMLRGARRVFVPNADVARRMRRQVPGVPYLVRTHPERAAPAIASRPAPPGGLVNAPPLAAARGGRRRIALLGAIGAHKGSLLLEQVAKHVRAERMPLDFVVVGYTDRDQALRAEGVEVTGPYTADMAGAMLAQAGADLVWLPAVWPETFSYTLTTALRQKVFPVVFDFGAPAERLRRLGWGARWPLEMMLDPKACARELLSLHVTPAPALDEPFVSYPDPLRTYYEMDAASLAPPAMASVAA